MSGETPNVDTFRSRITVTGLRWITVTDYGDRLR
jgi:hypothetical protein